MDQLTSELLELLRRSKLQPGEGVPQGATDDDIRGFESRTGITVPAGLREWLKTANGICLARGLFGIRPDRPFLDIEDTLRLYPQWTRLGWIPVANDGCGNYYVVATKGEFGDGEPIIFIDTLNDESKAAYVVASDTWHFLRFYLHEEIEARQRPFESTEEVLHLAAESPQWPFNKELVLREDPEILKFSSATLPWEA